MTDALTTRDLAHEMVKLEEMARLYEHQRAYVAAGTCWELYHEVRQRRSDLLRQQWELRRAGALVKG